MKYTLITLAALSGSVFAQTITPTSVSGYEPNRPHKGALSNIIDGDLSAAGGIVNRFDQSGPVTYTFGFDSPQDLNSLAVWQDADAYGSQGIDGFTLTFLDAGGAQIGSPLSSNLAASTTSSLDPNPEVYAFGTVSGVSLVRLDVTSAHNNYSDIREVAFNVPAPVPEPSSAALLVVRAFTGLSFCFQFMWKPVPFPRGGLL